MLCSEDSRERAAVGQCKHTVSFDESEEMVGRRLTFVGLAKNDLPLLDQNLEKDGGETKRRGEDKPQVGEGHLVGSRMARKTGEMIPVSWSTEETSQFRPSRVKVGEPQ